MREKKQNSVEESMLLPAWRGEEKVVAIAVPGNGAVRTMIIFSLLEASL